MHVSVRLNGWQRLWVVVGAAWAIVVVVVTYFSWPAGLLSMDPSLGVTLGPGYIDVPVSGTSTSRWWPGPTHSKYSPDWFAANAPKASDAPRGGVPDSEAASALAPGTDVTALMGRGSVPDSRAASAPAIDYDALAAQVRAQAPPPDLDANGNPINLPRLSPAFPGQTLAQAIRAKYPGVYRAMTDQQLEKAMVAKYPQYSKWPLDWLSADGVEDGPAGILRSLRGVSQSVKVKAWNDYHAAASVSDLRPKLASMALPLSARQRLLSAKREDGRRTAMANLGIYARAVAKALGIWAVPLGLLYLIGWSFAWVRRGFRNA